MTLQPIVPARPRPARCAELTDAPRPTRPVAARRGRLRASTAYSSAPHGTTQATHTASEHHQDQQAGPILAPRTRVRTAQVGPKLLPTWGQKSFSKTTGAFARHVLVV